MISLDSVNIAMNWYLMTMDITKNLEKNQKSKKNGTTVMTILASQEMKETEK